MNQRNILFVCKYNRFRSRVACNLLKKMNIQGVHVRSAGVFKGSAIDPLQKSVCGKQGIYIEGKTQGISTALLRWQDTIILVADDVPVPLFKEQKNYGKTLEVWKIPDAKKNDLREIQKIIVMIALRVKTLGRKLGGK